MTSRRDIDRAINYLANQSGDLGWQIYIAYIKGRVYKRIFPRVGQTVMSGLDRDLFVKITGTEFDIWEMVDADDVKLERFAEKVFEIYVENL